MSESLQAVLRCGECNKPFDKKSTLKRHGYYCRSQRIKNAPKSQSCISCARRKIKCDKIKPECSRCKVKNIECHYATKSAKTARERTQIRHDSSAQQKDTVNALILPPSSFQHNPEATGYGITHGDSALVTSETHTGEQDGNLIDWNIPDIDFSELISPEMNSIAPDPPPSWQPYADRVSMVDQIHSVNWSIPPQPTANPRLFKKRPETRPDVQRARVLIQHTLKSYLLTMLRHNSLPPFIHQSLTSRRSEMEALDDCISLVHMISGETRGSRKLFWKNVQMECERMYRESWKLSGWEILAAMQSISIYILFRLDEGETEHNDFDSLLLATFTVMAQQLTQKDIASGYSLERDWKDWLYEESRRRMAVLYRVVNMLVYFDPAKMCNLPPDLVLAPLPAKKELWDASDEWTWNAEIKKDSIARTDFGLTKSGELIKLGDDGNGKTLVHTAITSTSPLRKSASWEDWCSGMDGFGSLVMLAALVV